MSTPASGRTPLSTLGERGLIKLIRDRFPAPASLLPVGIGDDAAVVVPPRGELQVLTTDALVEGVHFDLSFSSLADVGAKAVAVNLSDIAAMGADPRLALLSLILPERLSVADVEQLLDGVAAAAGDARLALAGGNITRSPGPLIVDVTMTGGVGPRKFLTRAGGRPGDVLYVTGAIGAAAAGLGWLRGHAGRRAEPDDAGLAACVARHRRPEARWRLGRALGRNRAATACMDLSDGLADALRQLAESSGTGALIEAEALPIPRAAADWFAGQDQDPVAAALAGGDDYELLFSVSSRHRGRLRLVLRQSAGVEVTRIGELTAAPGVLVRRNGRTAPLPLGFTHF